MVADLLVDGIAGLAIMAMAHAVSAYLGSIRSPVACWWRELQPGSRRSGSSSSARS